MAITIEERDQPQGSSGPPAPRRSSGRLVRGLEAYALLGLTLVIAAFFSVWGPTADTFLSAANLRSLALWRNVWPLEFRHGRLKASPAIGSGAGVGGHRLLHSCPRGLKIRTRVTATNIPHVR